MSQVTQVAGVHDLYQGHSSWLRQLITNQLACRETAADLTHDTFLRLITRNEDVRNIKEPRAYLKCIARGLVANHWRRKDIEQAYLDTLSASPENYAPSPEQQQIVIETLWRIDHLLNGLPEKVRQAFLMSRLDGVRYVDIAETLQVSERMIKKYMAQAMLHCVSITEDMVE